MRKPLFATLSLIVVGLAASSPACADFANGSFENGTYVFDAQGADSLAPGSTAITGWTTFGGELAVIQNVNSFGISTPFGSHFLDLTGYHDASPYGGVQQSIATVPNVSYNLSLYLGVNDTVGANGPISVQVTAGANSTTLSANPTGAGMIWTLETWTFT
ncbi:MAG TPA: DUF642 domain-containing protein, partial [Isosphaeraceae bacterium]|nr:DUF642 domain-containing protein [Isosphaeraceae bacterium]